jgi:hypothetical protein
MRGIPFVVNEHNLDVIQDGGIGLIDLGPEGGEGGGRVGRAGTPEEVAGYAGSYTGAGGWRLRLNPPLAPLVKGGKGSAPLRSRL